jgi:CRISPR-associated protein Cas8b1/Cst1 subtype I-B
LGKAYKTDARTHTNFANITGYYFTNYGPKPDLEIVRLDNTVADFVQTVEQDDSQAWRRTVYLGWQRPKGQENDMPTNDNIRTWRNDVYESLFELPQKSHVFLRHLQRGQDWQLIELFLRKVLLMDQARIDMYRILGDRLVAYILEYEQGSSGFYYRFAREYNYSKFHRLIRSAEEKMLKAGATQPLFTYDEFIFAFEHPGDQRHQWRLGRDLISIRILEVLYAQGVDMSDAPDDSDQTDDTNGESE